MIKFKKYILTILFILVSVMGLGQITHTRHQINPSLYTDYAQQRYDTHPTENGWRTLAVFSGAIILDAAADAARDGGDKITAHILEAGSIATLISGIFTIDYQHDQWYWYVLSYIGLRVAMFDPAYNLFRGLPWNYHGTTSYWDGVWAEVDPPTGVELFGRAVFLTIGVTIPLQQIK